MIIKSFVFYPLLLTASIIGFAIGGSVSHKSAVNATLKMCNQKSNECKFKYDILMYNETGKVPYPLKVEEKPKQK
jgi:hypothetical protein